MRKVLIIMLSLSLSTISCGRQSGMAGVDSFGGSAGDSLQVNAAKEEVEVRRTMTADQIIIEKALTYDTHTLDDTYPYQDTVRWFKWDKIRAEIARLENAEWKTESWAVVQNRQNKNGEAPLARGSDRNKYNLMSDVYGVERFQGIPLYTPADSVDLSVPERYALDGSLMKLLEYHDSIELARVEAVDIGGEWLVPARYVKPLADTVKSFTRVVFVDRKFQNITTLEKSGDKWLVRSMNPATTGLHNPPFQHETPLGIFVIQEKKPKMIFLVDGTDRTGGYAPWASRFCNGGYIHGIPVNLPATAEIEFSWSLGTTPRSHMCVRNATSHAKFVYDWAPLGGSLVFVIE